MWRVSSNFDFVDGGRTFACEIQRGGAGGNDAWWWFRVSTDDRHRYAPFRADAADTETSVRYRVVAYYDDLMTRRGLPTNR
jgi:hypothetical protein